MIIKDVNGGELNLSTTRLREVKNTRSAYPNWLVLSELKAVAVAGVNEIQLHCQICPQGNCIKVDYSPHIFAIGCRTFSPATFAKILKAAGVRKPKPAKKGKKS